jgi:Cu-Zn family superoxide dismutase
MMPEIHAMPLRLTVAAVLIGLAPPALAAQHGAAEDAAEVDPTAAAEAPADLPQTVATFLDREGNAVGSANITEAAAGGVLINIEVEGLPPEAWLGFHIHENGVCDPEDDFESAGGHFDPHGAAHGYYAVGGPHAGDMPNQYVPASGILIAEVFNHMVSLEDADPANIRGRALMIHEHQDDYETQPTGDAGGRLACAVIE